MPSCFHYVLALSLLAYTTPFRAECAAWASVSGEILSSDPLIPLSQIQIRVMTLPTPTFESADSFGKFKIQLPPGPWSLNISAPGFKSADQKITLRPGQALQLKLSLNPTPYQADEVVINARRGPNKEIMQALNVPLEPTPTPFEKKIAPTLQKVKWGMMISIWTLILLGALGLREKQ